MTTPQPIMKPQLPKSEEALRRKQALANGKAALDAKYELLEKIGEGAFSEVKKGVNRQTGDVFAIKIIDRSKCVGKEYLIQSEISILQQVKHPNIIQLYELFETEARIYLVIQYVSGGELFDSIVARGHYTEVDAAKIVEKILCAIKYLHDLGIAHRDLKPENLLFYSTEPDSKIMISDFGLSKIFNDAEVMKTACGTPGYVAPEVLKRKGYGREVDIWSLGVITYILLCGYPPFYHENNQELFQLIMKAEYIFDKPHWDKISDEATDFINKMLLVDPSRRMTAEQALKHPFITMNTVASVEEFTPLWETEKLAGVPEQGVRKSQSPTTQQTGATATGTMAINDKSKTTGRVPQNIAEGVANNLRTRGMSTSVRRKSVDVQSTGVGFQSATRKATVPTHAPPTIPTTQAQKIVATIVTLPPPPSHPPPTSVIEEADKNTDGDQVIRTAEEQPGRPLAPKPDDDSGLHVNNSTSTANVSGSSNLDSNDDLSFLTELAKVNRLIEEGRMQEASYLLQTVDGCPHKLRQLYGHILLSAGVAMDKPASSSTRKVMSTDAGTLVGKQKLSTESFLADIALLVERMKSHEAKAAAVCEDELVKSFEKLKNQYDNTQRRSSRPDTTNGRTLQSLLDKARTKLEGLFTGPPRIVTPAEITRAPSHMVTLAQNHVSLGTPATVSPLCAFQHPTPPCITDTKTSPLRMLSYNLFLRPPNVKYNNSNSAYKDARLSHFLVHVLPHYDVLCLQEVFAFGSNRRDRLLRKAKEEGFHYWVCSPSKLDSSMRQTTKTIIDGGLMLLSRFPIVDRDRMTFEDGVSGDKFCGKGVLYAKIQMPFIHGADGSVVFMHVFNTQLQANESARNYRVFDPAEECTLARSRQIRVLKSFIDSHVKVHGDRDLVLLMGDLNVNSRRGTVVTKDSDEYLIMKRVLEGGQYTDSGAGVSVTDLRAAEGQQIFRVRDLVHEKLGYHPVTYGDLNHVNPSQPGETILSNRAMLGVTASIDYILHLQFTRVIEVDGEQKRTAITPSGKDAFVDVAESHIEMFQKYIPSPEDLLQMDQKLGGKIELHTVFSNNETSDMSVVPLGNSSSTTGQTESTVEASADSLVQQMDQSQDVMASDDGVNDVQYAPVQYDSSALDEFKRISKNTDSVTIDPMAPQESVELREKYKQHLELIRAEQFTQLSDHYAVAAVIRGYTQ